MILDYFGEYTLLVNLIYTKFAVLGFSHMLIHSSGFHVSTEASLGFVASSLTIGVVLSLAKKSE